MLPYLWEFRGRALFALACLVLSKTANVGVPLVLKGIVDSFERPAQQALVLPVALLAAYGVLKLGASLFNELRDLVFARVRFRAMRRLSTRVMEHLHALALRFHLERQTGALSRDLERGARSVSTILNYLVFSVLPILVAARTRVPELDAAYSEIVAEKRARSAVVVHRGIARGDLDAGADVELVVDCYVSPIFYRFLVTDAPLDDEYASAVVDMTLRAFGT
jgi:ABC-type multidrug transport system fused ATPase/permease subunit